MWKAFHGVQNLEEKDQPLKHNKIHKHVYMFAYTYVGIHVAYMLHVGLHANHTHTRKPNTHTHALHHP